MLLNFEGELIPLHRDVLLAPLGLGRWIVHTPDYYVEVEETQRAVFRVVGRNTAFRNNWVPQYIFDRAAAPRQNIERAETLNYAMEFERHVTELRNGEAIITELNQSLDRKQRLEEMRRDDPAEQEGGGPPENTS